MKIKIFYFTTCFLLLYVNLYAQNENNVWTFGAQYGMDFNSGSPKLFRTNILTKEGCASICNSSGKLLFYTNSVKVWDSTHKLMPNGSGLWGDSVNLSSTMGAAIVPLASDSNLYFVFSLSSAEDPERKGIYYSLIDMRLNGGKGDVVAGKKNIPLPDTGLSEKMLVVPTCGGVWLLTHHIDSPIFYAYKISDTTIPKPTRSVTSGIIYEKNYLIGEMKMSPDFSRIAMTSTQFFPFPIRDSAPKPTLEILDFDVNTGIVSGAKVIDTAKDGYLVEFSPDGSKLYASDLYEIYQYDLSLIPSFSAVTASKFRINTIVAEFPIFYAMKRGPDGKIYLWTILAETWRLNSPDNAGIACGLEANIADLTMPFFTFFSFGNNTYRPITETAKAITTSKDTAVCQGIKISFPGRPGAVYKWNDGSASLTRTINTSGKYWLTSALGCNLFVDTFRITILPTTKTLKKTDTLFCFDDKLTIQATAADRYFWSSGDTTRSFNIDRAGIYWVTGETSTPCASRTDTFKVTQVNFSLDVPDTILCNGAVVLDADIQQPAQYIWQDGSTGTSLLVNRTGKYWVEVSVGRCKKRDDIIVSDLLNPALMRDTLICAKESITLQAAEIIGAKYLWNTGKTTSELTINAPGSYSVTVTKDGCSSSDTIMVATEKCDQCIKLPNAFTPNGDGLNDVFKAIVSCRVSRYYLKIFNRYGEEVFNTTDYLKGWDGNIKGQEAELGIYFYLIQASFAGSDKDELYKGDVAMIR